jgi:hypothetical protein
MYRRARERVRERRGERERGNDFILFSVLLTLKYFFVSFIGYSRSNKKQTRGHGLVPGR